MEVIQECVEFLDLLNSHSVHEVLPKLLNLISATAQEESVRESISSSTAIWDMLTKSLTYYTDKELSVDQIRALRGLVLLSRNVVISCRERSKLLAYYQKLVQLVRFQKDQSEIIQNLNVAFLQFLVNLTSSMTPVNVEDGDDIKQLHFEYDYKYLKQFLLSTELDQVSDNCKDTLLTFMNNLYNSSDLLYNFLNDKDSVSVLTNHLDYFNSIKGESESLNEQEVLVLSLFQKVFLHESFIKFWNHLSYDDAKQLEILNLSQLILTNKDSFGELELTTVLSWLVDLYDIFAPQVITSLQEGKTDELAYMKLFKILDISTNMGKFNHARDFFNHYKFLPKICSLFHVLEKHLERQTLKQVNIDDKRLPGLKTLLVEIITFMIYQNFDNQEYVREAHVLEIILNNCQLDKNEPFIKERSIVCLKYLLENNVQNQEFVRQLQPEKVQINDEVKLEQMGIELDIGKDGKVHVHNKNTDMIKELK